MSNAAAASWPANGSRRVLECPACQHTERELLHAELTDLKFGAPGEWNLMRCLACRSAFLDPQPTPESIVLAYSTYYTHTAPAQVGTKIAALRRAARNGYINRRWDAGLQPASKLLSYLVDALPLIRIKIDHQTLRSQSPPVKNGRPETLLDVGCGGGEFLALASKAGWKVTGIDFDPAAVKLGRNNGLDIRLGGIELFEGQSEVFDCITLSHVIEHVFDPQQVLKACFRLLKKGGRLWIETPNIDSSGHSQHGRHWRGLEPPRHLVIFNCRSLQRLLQSCGFSDIRPAPWRPERYFIDKESEFIAGNTALSAIQKITTALRRLFAELLAFSRHETRDFTTYIASKPSNPAAVD